MGIAVRRLEPHEWVLLRTTRLRALADAPYAFGSTFEAESGRPDEWWVKSLTDLAWFIAWDPALAGGEPLGIVAGLVPGGDPGSRAVISMWVSEEARGGGAAGLLLDAVEAWARSEAAPRLLLRVSDRNDRAIRFYRRRGFVATGDEEPLRSDPTAMAVEMCLDLGGEGSAFEEAG